ncbi:MAG TPA: hypothetical protein VJN43_22115 [Bryobacteraceae bacterium]|nr:hypothetical protein [Bryobacteraceae bacterium]
MFDLIKSKGFDVTNFRLDEQEDRAGSRIFHVDRITFVSQPEFYIHFGPIAVTWSPSYQVRIESAEHLRDFNIKYSCLQTWLASLRKQVGVQDPWKQLSTQVLDRTLQSVKEATDTLRSAGKPTAAAELGEAIADLSRQPDPDLTGAVQHSLAALECIAREKCGDNATMGKLIERYPTLFPKPIDSAVERIWGFASEMGRHVREGRLPNREEVELMVGMSAVCCSYIARKLHLT